MPRLLPSRHLLAALLACGFAPSAHLQAATPPVKVNIDNYAQAETAYQFERVQQMAGGVNRWQHNRTPTPIDKQNVIRMNRDTLYSFAIVDISQSATLTLPEAGQRYRSVMVINEDHYINRIYHKAGSYRLTPAEFGSPYVLVAVRTLVNPNDAADVQAANALQNQLKITAASARPFPVPNYDKTSYEATYQPLLKLSEGLPDAKRTFGKKSEVSETRHLIGTAFGWGGLPTYEAFYINRGENKKAGNYRLTVRDVPVDAFWSISIYNKDGYFEKNPFDSYSLNSLTAKPNPDGSVTLNFGTDPAGKDNFLYVMDGWNYTVRLYRPREAVQSGKWTFPEPQPAP
ncbi:DUF1214 domain-containing protein [Crenobacter caeni]|uniref:DUF1214 domain-containing protein n=1 Tax=Crenobacter caeni TaxID=2705474 RepID=A0A6B2KTJ4_9NEIS|nr:DUF1214 domain-containing protein [Crenobacter caeni]NDV13552.1 DUF1214 domain-containing protein [Crenobacter caeni]